MPGPSRRALEEALQPGPETLRAIVLLEQLLGRLGIRHVQRVERHAVEAIRSGARRGEYPLDRASREAVVVLEAGETLLLHGGADHPILEETGAGVVPVVDAEDLHGDRQLRGRMRLVTLRASLIGRNGWSPDTRSR